MRLSVEPGRYVLAVSGGVDSMALLDILRRLSSVELVVAHYDHGLRVDSEIDRKLVQSVADRRGLPFYYEAGKLGVNASEALARRKRYEFLERIRQQEHARAIITAHHQDDLVETAILNLLRGTGRKGLTALQSNAAIIRPMLHMTKDQIRAYARERNLEWREDASNSDERYLRNYIRRQLLPKFTAEARSTLLKLIDDARDLNVELDQALAEWLGASGTAGGLDRRQFTRLPHAVAKEALASWLRAHGLADFDAPLIERATVAAKTQAPGTIIDLMHGVQIYVGRDKLALQHIER